MNFIKNTFIAVLALALSAMHVTACTDFRAKNSRNITRKHISKNVKKINKNSMTYRLLDLTNAHEIQEVCNLFSDKDIQATADLTKEEMKSFLDLIHPGKKYDNWKVYVAQNAQGNICGCIAYSLGDAATAGNNEATINPLVVAPNCTWQKVATGLMQKLHNDYPHLKACKIYISNYSDAAKANAMHFFTQNGFVEFEKNKGMRKVLGACQEQSSVSANPNIEIKVVNKNDAQEIQSLANLFIYEEIQKVIDWRPESIIANAQGFDDLVYIAKAADGAVCGVLIAIIDGESAATSSKMIICTVATHPQYRNQGIAMQLLQKIEAVCRSKNLPRLELWVIADNEKAVRCYQKAGFTEFANSIGLRAQL